MPAMSTRGMRTALTTYFIYRPNLLGLGSQRVREGSWPGSQAGRFGGYHQGKAGFLNLGADWVVSGDSPSTPGFGAFSEQAVALSRLRHSKFSASLARLTIPSPRMSVMVMVRIRAGPILVMVIPNSFLP